MVPLQVVKPNVALKLRANRDFVDRYASYIHGGQPVARSAGDEWLFEGPATYFPQVEVDIVEMVNSWIVKPNQALKLKAKRSCIDRDNKPRKGTCMPTLIPPAGEQWLMRVEGAYLPRINEEIIQFVDAIVLTEKKALHLKATRTFKDVFGIKRKAGEEWLVTHKDKETHIPDVYEKIVKEVPLLSLSNREWCIIHNPVDESKSTSHITAHLIRRTTPVRTQKTSERRSQLLSTTW